MCTTVKILKCLFFTKQYIKHIRVDHSPEVSERRRGVVFELVTMGILEGELLMLTVHHIPTFSTQTALVHILVTLETLGRMTEATKSNQHNCAFITGSEKSPDIICL